LGSKSAINVKKNNLIVIDWGRLENTDQFITPKIALSNPNLAQASGLCSQPNATSKKCAR